MFRKLRRMIQNKVELVAMLRERIWKARGAMLGMIAVMERGMRNLEVVRKGKVCSPVVVSGDDNWLSM